MSTDLPRNNAISRLRRGLDKLPQEARPSDYPEWDGGTLDLAWAVDGLG